MTSNTTRTSSTKRRAAHGIGAAIAAGVAFGTLGISAASATSDVTQMAGITVPGNATAAPATLVASLEGRNEVTSGAPVGQALELIGIQGNTLSYSVTRSRGAASTPRPRPTFTPRVEEQTARSC
jgi:hypothetical protein